MTTVIDYKAGNLTSVRLAFEALGEGVRVTSDPAEVRRATRLVFPGVGAAGAAMANLRVAGLGDVIRERVAAGVPFLGICLGMQILFESSEEDGGVETLGILPGKVVRFRPSVGKIPHIGWNETQQQRAHPLLAGIPDGCHFYFVHSYHPVPADVSDTVCRTAYNGTSFASMVSRGNVSATQFHPEKSGEAGLRILRNFLNF